MNDSSDAVESLPYSRISPFIVDVIFPGPYFENSLEDEPVHAGWWNGNGSALQRDRCGTQKIRSASWKPIGREGLPAFRELLGNPPFRFSFFQ